MTGMRPAPHGVGMKTDTASCVRAPSTRVNRRVFLYDIGRMLGAMLVPMLGDTRARLAATGTLRVLALVENDDASARPSLLRGIEMGADEAKHTMALFGMSLALTVRRVSGAAAAASERTAMHGPRSPSVLIRALGDGCLTSQPKPTVPTIDIACSDYGVSEMDATMAADQPGSRAASASARVLLHVRPSRSTLQRVRSHVTDTLSQAPNSRRSVELWHQSLERFGGEQLNQRYRRRFGEPMDSDSWAGWIAVKIAAESALRAHATTPAALAVALTDARAQFDGHKGQPLTFHPISRELLQPLYVVAAGADTDSAKVVAEFIPGDR